MGRDILANNTSDNNLTNFGGWATNIAGGAAGGALTGFAMGGPYGAGYWRNP